MNLALQEILSEDNLDKIKKTPIKKGDQRKREILEAAIHCIAVDGIESATFESIASRAGIRHSLVVYYFPDKKELIASATQYISATAQIHILKTIAQAKRGEHPLKKYIRAYFSWINHHRHHAAMCFLVFHYCTFHPRYQKLYRISREAEINRLIDLLWHIAENKNVSASAMKRFSATLHNLIIGTMIDMVGRASIKQTKQFERITLEHALLLWETFLNRESVNESA